MDQPAIIHGLRSCAGDTRDWNWNEQRLVIFSVVCTPDQCNNLIKSLELQSILQDLDHPVITIEKGRHIELENSLRPYAYLDEARISCAVLITTPSSNKTEALDFGIVRSQRANLAIFLQCVGGQGEAMRPRIHRQARLPVVQFAVDISVRTIALEEGQRVI